MYDFCLLNKRFCGFSFCWPRTIFHTTYYTRISSLCQTVSGRPFDEVVVNIALDNHGGIVPLIIHL
jgi:hypothetical protein